MGSSLQHWFESRSADLSAMSKIFPRIYEEGIVQPGSEITVSMAATFFMAAALGYLAWVMVTRKGRQAVFRNVESVLSVALVIILLCFVLGLPFGALFLVYKSAAYLLRNLAASSVVEQILNRFSGA